jgi:two-component system sensor histidine kinase KdpD
MRAAEADRLRQALLTSISHDLRTPLAAILGAAGTLRDFDADLGDAARADLLGTVVAEAERLNRFIANLLDMTRLESGAVAPARTPQDLAEVIASALERAARVLSHHHVTVDLADDLPMVEIDPVLFEQALFNLLDNAAKYAPEGSTVLIEARPTAAGGAAIRVVDEGEGIPPDEIERVFDKFHRVHKGDRVRAGTGLGLAVCRGFVEAMGGRVTAGNRADRAGAAFTVTLPAPAAPPAEHAA